MISFTQLAIFGVVELIGGFALGWFARGLRKSAEKPSAGTRRAAGSTIADIDGQRFLLTEIDSLVQRHAGSVESFQSTIECPTSEAELKSQIAGLRDANRKLDRGVGGKITQLEETGTSDLGDVAGSVSGYCAKTESLDSLLGLVSSESTADQMTALLSKAIADVLESKQRLETELSEAQCKLEDQTAKLSAAEQDARVDPLTKLRNRRAFDEQVAAAHALFERQQQRFALLMLDVDHFKSFNDTHGHAAGDIVLQTVGRVLSERKRGSDHVFRIGGEEFVVLLHLASPAEAKLAAERLRQGIESTTVIYEGRELNVTTSVGVANVEEGVGPMELLARADEALYAAKEAGRNQSCTYESEAPADDSESIETERAENPDEMLVSAT